MRTYSTIQSLLFEPVPSVGEQVQIGGRDYLVAKVSLEKEHQFIRFVPVKEVTPDENLTVDFFHSNRVEE